VYTPVLISVYDRVDCLEACTNSLKANEEASKTDLYIAVDHASKNEDAKRIQNVIRFCKNIKGFNTVQIIEREKNLGPNRNMREARHRLLKEHVSLITLEDDNVVSPNFLHYMNGALGFYGKYENVVCVCGYNFPIEIPSEYKGDVYVWTGVNAYGVGWWREKLSETYWNYNNFMAFLHNAEMVSAFMNIAEHILPIAISGLSKGVIYADAVLSYNLFMNKKYQLYPTVSKVRNIGYDGKGMNCNVDGRYTSQIIDTGEKKISFDPYIQPDPGVYKKLYEFFRIDEKLKTEVYSFIESYKNSKADVKQSYCKNQRLKLGVTNEKDIDNNHNENINKIYSPVTHSKGVSFVRNLEVNGIIAEYQKYSIDVSKYFANLDRISIYECKKSGYRFFYPLCLEGDGEFYSQLQRFPWYYMDDKWEFEKGLELITPRDCILEIGCGAGAFLKKGKKLGLDMNGLEINKFQCERLWADGYRVLNKELIDIGDEFSEYFDVVCAFQVMEHISDVKRFIETSLKMLKKGGKLILSVPNHDSFMGLDERNALDLPPHHMGMWGEKALIALEGIFKMRINSIHIEPLQSYHMDYYESLMNRRYSDVFNIAPNIIQYAKKYSERIKGFSILAEFMRG